LSGSAWSSTAACTCSSLRGSSTPLAPAARSERWEGQAGEWHESGGTFQERPQSLMHSPRIILVLTGLPHVNPLGCPPLPLPLAFASSCFGIPSSSPWDSGPTLGRAVCKPFLSLTSHPSFEGRAFMALLNAAPPRHERNRLAGRLDGSTMTSRLRFCWLCSC
jgi:hypothetical protein